MRMPVARYIDPTAEPDTIVSLGIIEKPGQRGGTARAARKTAMQPDREHLGRALPLGIEQIEAIAQIGEELVARIEALRCGKSHVVGVKRIGNDKMRAVWAADPLLSEVTRHLEQLDQADS